MTAQPTLPKAPPDAPPDAARLLAHLEWRVLRRLDGILQGDYRTLFRGFGLDLSDIREYQYGDDVRHIDWNASARLPALHVRQFNEDRDVTAWFLVDISASMGFGSGERTKRALAIEFTAALAQLLTRHGNRVGALLQGDAIAQILPARNSRRHLLQLIASMQKTAPQVSESPTDLARMFGQAAQYLRRRSLVFVISDFISVTPWQEALARLSMRHEVIAVRPIDPLELALPDMGMVPLRDAETGETLWVDTSSAKFRARFEALAQAREAQIAQGLGRAGVDTLGLATDEDLADSVLRFAQLRKFRMGNVNRARYPEAVVAS